MTRTKGPKGVLGLRVLRWSSLCITRTKIPKVVKGAGLCTTRTKSLKVFLG